MKIRKSILLKISVIAALLVFAVIAMGANPVETKKETSLQIWGITMPAGAKQTQKYRDTFACTIASLDPEAAKQNILTLMGDSTNIYEYKSKIGSTVLIFLEDRSTRPWNAIQISGIAGKPGSIVVVTRRRVTTGWQWRNTGKRWDYR